MFIRTQNFVNWDKFLERRDEPITFTLDFEIDAGFSFSSAISRRMIQKGALSVVKQDARKNAKVCLTLNYQLKEIGIQVGEVQIIDISNDAYEATDRYWVSATFSILEQNYISLKSLFNQDNSYDENISKEDKLMVFFSKYFGDKARKLVNEIISYIELSGFYARQVPATLNLYLNNGDRQYLRVTQIGGRHNSSAQYPIHPLLIRSKAIILKYESNLSIPKNLQKHYKKGIHYQFLGFYDESFLCFYKIVETIFKDENFSKKLSETIFRIPCKVIPGTIKSSNQKIMMLYIDVVGRK